MTSSGPRQTGQRPQPAPSASEAPEASGTPEASGAPSGSTQPVPVPPVPVPPVQPQWAWARPVETRTIETEPLEYHRLYRGVANYRWWRPLLVLVLTLTFFLLLSVIFGLLLGAVLFLVKPPEEVFALVETLAIPDTQNPLSVLVGLLSVILTMIPAVWLAMWAAGLRPAKRVFSVALRVRWGLLGRTAGYAALSLIGVNLAVTIVLGLLLSGGEASVPEMPDIDVRAALISMTIVLLLVPVQAAAEEIVFRGALMQALGAWLRNPWFAILLPAIGFGLAHIASYGLWGMLSVGIMGVVAAWLTWRTGGLEAAISLHIINNLLAFGAMSTGLGGSTEQTDEGMSPLGIIAQGISFALFIWLTLRGFKKGRYGRTRVDLIEVPVAASVPQTAAAPGPGTAPVKEGSALPDSAPMAQSADAVGAGETSTGEMSTGDVGTAEVRADATGATGAGEMSTGQISTAETGAGEMRTGETSADEAQESEEGSR